MQILPSGVLAGRDNPGGEGYTTQEADETCHNGNHPRPRKGLPKGGGPVDKRHPWWTNGPPDEVAWVRVRVQEPRLQQLDQVRIEQRRAELPHIASVALTQLLAGDPLKGQDRVGGELADDRGDLDTPQRGHVAIEGGGVTGPPMTLWVKSSGPLRDTHS